MNAISSSSSFTPSISFQFLGKCFCWRPLRRVSFLPGSASLISFVRTKFMIERMSHDICIKCLIFVQLHHWFSSVIFMGLRPNIMVVRPSFSKLIITTLLWRIQSLVRFMRNSTESICLLIRFQKVWVDDGIINSDCKILFYLYMW